jgi:hypothetical protein
MIRQDIRVCERYLALSTTIGRSTEPTGLMILKDLTMIGRSVLNKSL